MARRDITIQIHCAVCKTPQMLAWRRGVARPCRYLCDECDAVMYAAGVVGSEAPR